MSHETLQHPVSHPARPDNIEFDNIENAAAASDVLPPASAPKASSSETPFQASSASAISIFPQTPANITQRGKNVAQLASNLPQSAPSLQDFSLRRPTFALYTLGCKVNQYDSHQIARSLIQRGFRRVEFRECADLYVIDTCTVTSEADKKSRKAAGRARRNNPDAVVAVTGCAAAYARDQFERAAPGALVLDNTQKLELPERALDALLARPDWASEYSKLRNEIGSEPLPSATRERAVLKIQDGCNHNCSYCIIPTVRGASVLKSRESVLAEARAFVHEGARELTITGVSMSDWGREESRHARQESKNAELCDLIRAVSTIEGLERVRVSSLDPADVDDEFLHTIANSPKVCPHIHLALQSGSASTLRRMRRRYTPEMFLKAAGRWREIRPDGGLTTDIIVGFPGETEEEFQESMRVARESQFSAIHVFPYSPRAGTVAADLPDHVAPAVQNRRVDELLQLARQLSTRYASQFIGQTIPVLVETTQNNIIEGMTEPYVKARVQLNDTSTYIAPGDLVWFKVEQWNGEALIGNQLPRWGRE